MDLTTKHFSLCTERSGFFCELDLTWFKSNALINTNAPFRRGSALSWAINQLTDGLPHRPCWKHSGSLLGPYLVLEPDRDAVERFLINTTLLVVPLFCGSLVNYGECLVCAAAFKVEAGFWTGTALSSQTQAAACLDVDILVSDATRWNASLSIICSVCSVTGTWCLDFFVQMQVRADLFFSLYLLKR